jgi:hypothetical protein
MRSHNVEEITSGEGGGGELGDGDLGGAKGVDLSSEWFVKTNKRKEMKRKLKIHDKTRATHLFLLLICASTYFLGTLWGFFGDFFENTKS